MRILLINPSLISSDIGHYKKEVERNRGIYPPLGLCYVSSALKKHGHIVEILDCDASSYFDIKIFDPHVVGIYVMTWTFHNAKEWVSKLRKILPNTIFIAGGPNTMTFPQETLDIGGFDYAIKGEAEEIIEPLLQMLDTSTNRILEGKIITDLDSIEKPDRSWMNYERYFDVFTKNRLFTTMITSRGCPYNCIYCDRKNRMGKKWRQHSPKRIVDEISEIHDQGIKEIMFFDDEFIIDKDRIYEICELLHERNIKIDWECRARVDQVDLHLLRTMKRAGCYRIRYGFESGDDRTLKILKKGITTEQSLECSRISKKAGVEIFGYFMLGCPEETKDSVKKTIDFAMELDSDFSIFSQVIMIPGSELFDWGIANNLIKKDHWINYLRGEITNGNPTIDTIILPSNYVRETINKANKQFCFRPAFLYRQIKSIRSLDQLNRKITMARALV